MKQVLSLPVSTHAYISIEALGTLVSMVMRTTGDPSGFGNRIGAGCNSPYRLLCVYGFFNSGDGLGVRQKTSSGSSGSLFQSDPEHSASLICSLDTVEQFPVSDEIEVESVDSDELLPINTSTIGTAHSGVPSYWNFRCFTVVVSEAG